MIAPSFDYTDGIMFGNVAEMINRDMLQTMQHNPEIEKGLRIEENPILRGNTGNKDFMGAYGLLTTGMLGKRWGDMQDGNQRKLEMLLAQLVQAYALNRSGEPWKIQTGYQF